LPQALRREWWTEFGLRLTCAGRNGWISMPGLIQINSFGAANRYQMRMRSYRLDFLTHANRVYHSTEIQARDDEDARAQAKRLKTRIGKGYKIWDGERPVHTETY
jgi:hypothetical protein